DQGDRWYRRLMSALTQLRAAPPHLLDVCTDGVDARTDAAAIRFELRLTGTSRANTAAEPRQRLARADESGQEIFQLRELDLQLAFTSPRTPRKDVENQLRAIDDLAADLFFDLLELRRRQFVVEDDDVDVGLGAGRSERLDLPGAEKR